MDDGTKKQILENNALEFETRYPDAVFNQEIEGVGVVTIDKKTNEIVASSDTSIPEEYKPIFQSENIATLDQKVQTSLYDIIDKVNNNITEQKWDYKPSDITAVNDIMILASEDNIVTKYGDELYDCLVNECFEIEKGRLKGFKPDFLLFEKNGRFTKKTLEKCLHSPKRIY